jgi:hypothetical protein
MSGASVSELGGSVSEWRISGGSMSEWKISGGSLSEWRFRE